MRAPCVHCLPFVAGCRAKDRPPPNKASLRCTGFSADSRHSVRSVAGDEDSIPRCVRNTSADLGGRARTSRETTVGWKNAHWSLTATRIPNARCTRNSAVGGGDFGSQPSDATTRPTHARRTAEDADAALRPKSLDEFIGQQAARENLRVFVHAAKSRGEALDHVLLHGPPGLGKTTLAGILAREMGVGFRATSGPVIAKSGDLAALLTNLEDGDVLFIDEIHRLNPAVEEVLYPAMEDRALDLMIGEGPSARSVRIDLPRFTLIGATTRQGLLTTPLRDRFGIPVRLNFYTVEELEQVVRRAARLLSVDLDRGRRARDRAPLARDAADRRAGCCAACAISPMRRAPTRSMREVADKALSRLEIDALGLDAMDRRYLTMIADLYGGGPVGRGNARRGPQRAARHDRGRDRAVPHSARPHRPHRTRALPQRPRLRPSRPAGAARQPDRTVRSREQRPNEFCRHPGLDPGSTLSSASLKKRWIPAFAG